MNTDPNLPTFNKLAKLLSSDYSSAGAEAKREIDPVSARRLLMNQVLVMALESNTRKLIRAQLWPSKDEKLLLALHARIDELYERVFRFTPSRHMDWLLQVSGLFDGATVSLLSIAVQNDADMTEPLYELLIQLAKLAGTHYDEDEHAEDVEQDQATNEAA